jgi:hypothetical protein
MNITCKNCGQIYTGHYCNNCGQPAETNKINIHYLWKDIRHDLLHYNQGITYTAKQLFTRPGHSIREYIEGKRIKHFKPISLVMLLATAYIALIHILEIDMFVKTKEAVDTNSHLNVEELAGWLNAHFAWITLACIPLHTIGTAICFRKQNYNFVEYLVLNTYKASQKLYISILFIPLFYYFSGTATIATITTIAMFIDFCLYFWTNEQFFNQLSMTKTFFLTLLTHLIFWSLFFAIVAIIVLGFGLI